MRNTRASNDGRKHDVAGGFPADSPLAVRRPSVTTALNILEGNNYLETARGFVTITHRRELEDFAGEA